MIEKWLIIIGLSIFSLIVLWHLGIIQMVLWLTGLPIRLVIYTVNWIQWQIQHWNYSEEDIIAEQRFEELMGNKILYAYWIAGLRREKTYSVRLERSEILPIIKNSPRFRKLKKNLEAALEITVETIEKENARD